MELKIIIKVLLLIISAFSVFLIFDGRVLLTKRVGTEKINKIVNFFKVLGIILLVTSLYLIYTYGR